MILYWIKYYSLFEPECISFSNDKEVDERFHLILKYD